LGSDLSGCGFSVTSVFSSGACLGDRSANFGSKEAGFNGWDCKEVFGSDGGGGDGNGDMKRFLDGLSGETKTGESGRAEAVTFDVGSGIGAGDLRFKQQKDELRS